MRQVCPGRGTAGQLEPFVPRQQLQEHGNAPRIRHVAAILAFVGRGVRVRVRACV